MFNAIMPPISVYLASLLVNKIADARVTALRFEDVIPIVVGLWLTFVIQRAVGAYIGLGKTTLCAPGRT
jgi:hypothetical protein